MQGAGEPSPFLRPLSIGEIFDRAVTLYVRYFGVFSAIVLVVVLPLAVLQYFAALQNSRTFVEVIDQLQHPGRVSSVQDSGTAEAIALGIIAGALLLRSYAIVAIAAAVGRLYAERSAEAAACLRHALRHAGAVVLTCLCEIAVVASAAFVGAMILGFVLVAAVLLVQKSAVLGIIAFIAAALLSLAWLAGLLLCFLAFEFAFTAIGAENAAAGAAISHGFSRIFTRSEIGRALLFCLAFAAVYLGQTLLLVSVAVTLLWLKLPLMEVVVSALTSFFATAVLGVLIVVYYFDVRVRREGLDIQKQLDALQLRTLPS